MISASVTGMISEPIVDITMIAWKRHTRYLCVTPCRMSPPGSWSPGSTISLTQVPWCRPSIWAIMNQKHPIQCETRTRRRKKPPRVTWVCFSFDWSFIRFAMRFRRATRNSRRRRRTLTIFRSCSCSYSPRLSPMSRVPALTEDREGVRAQDAQVEGEAAEEVWEEPAHEVVGGHLRRVAHHNPVFVEARHEGQRDVEEEEEVHGEVEVEHSIGDAGLEAHEHGQAEGDVEDEHG